jgi:hypothetical protein
MTAAKRQHAGAAVGGLFDRPSATGGLAGRDHAGDAQQPPPRSDGHPPDGRAGESRIRLGIELSERETEFLRALSRPARTGEPRTLGSKFVGTGILAAAIELLAESGIDMYGIATGDLNEMTARARTALLRAGASEPNKEAPNARPSRAESPRGEPGERRINGRARAGVAAECAAESAPELRSGAECPGHQQHAAEGRTAPDWRATPNPTPSTAETTTPNRAHGSRGRVSWASGRRGWGRRTVPGTGGADGVS